MNSPDTPLARKLAYSKITYTNVNGMRHGLQSRIRTHLHVTVVESLAGDLASAQWPCDPVLR
jgi:hypothetical protein